MSWFTRLFGGKDARSETPIREYYDFRSEDEKQIALHAMMDLGGEDEQLARKLCSLQRQQDATGNTIPQAVREIKRIGEHLGANGGDKRMRRVAYRVQVLGGHARQLEYDWEGICGWLP